MQSWDRAGPLFWSFGYWFVMRQGRACVDPLEDHTFFMVGNVQAWRRAREIGFPFRVTEQSWMVPTEAGCLERLLQQIMEGCRRDRLRTAIFDVVYLPPDGPFLLSSSRALP